MILRYSVTSLVHLELCAFYNAGLTREEIREAVEQIRDGNLYVWIDEYMNVRTIRTDPGSIDYLVWKIESRLNELLCKKSKSPKSGKPSTC